MIIERLEHLLGECEPSPCPATIKMKLRQTPYVVSTFNNLKSSHGCDTAQYDLTACISVSNAFFTIPMMTGLAAVANRKPGVT